MKYVLRPMVVGTLALAMVASAPAQSKLSHLVQEFNPLLSHSQGYLGVLVGDVDTDSAAKLKLKDTRGAVITLIDHDAPAGSVLHVNDVVLQVNGQNVDSAEQFSRMLRELPAGRKVSLLVSRDGAQQTISVELCDRKVMEQSVWNKMNKGDGLAAPAGGMALMPGGATDGGSGMHMHLFTSSLHVGAVIEPLTGQMADYLGVTNGVMVKHIERKSEAEAAGLKPFDVILKVGGDAIKTAADWDRALRANEGKSVQVTILRERKQQTVNLQVDSKHKSQLNGITGFPEEQVPELAQLDQAFEHQLAAGQRFQEEMNGFLQKFTPEQRKEWQKQADELAQAFKDHGFAFPESPIDPKQVQDLQRQMQEFGKNFDIEQFRINPKQMEELNREMQEWQKLFPQIPCAPDHFIRYERESQHASRQA